MFWEDQYNVCWFCDEQTALRLAFWVKFSADDISKCFFFFLLFSPDNRVLTYRANCRHYRQFSQYVKSLFSGENKKTYNQFIAEIFSAEDILKYFS